MNRQSFNTTTKNGIEQLNKFLNVLLELNSDMEASTFNDIHITQEESFTVVEWEEVPYDHSWGGRWQFVNEDEYVMIEKYFPDNHIEMCYDEEDYKARLEEFLEENPGWVMGQFGNWTNEYENRNAYLYFNDNKLLDAPINETLKYAGSPIDFLDLLIDNTKKDRLIHRTDYIAVGPLVSKILNRFYIESYDSNEKINLRYSTKNVQILTFDLDEQKFDESKPTCFYKNDLQVYYKESVGDEIWFLTSNNVLLYKIKVEDIEDKEDA